MPSNPESDLREAVVNQELYAMEQRLLMWKESYLGWPAEDAVREYQREVEEIFFPYLMRLRDEGEISPAQLSRITAFLDLQIEELRAAKVPGG